MELTKEYARAYVEVLEVIKFLKEEDYNKIPKYKIELYEGYKDLNYKFVYNPKEKLDKQVSFEAKNVLANLFIKYISTQEDRAEFYDKERKEWYENEMKRNHDSLRPLFEKEKVLSTENVEEIRKDENKMTSLSEKEENIFKRIILKIKSFFGM